MCTIFKNIRLTVFLEYGIIVPTILGPEIQPRRNSEAKTSWWEWCRHRKAGHTCYWLQREQNDSCCILKTPNGFPFRVEETRNPAASETNFSLWQNFLFLASKRYYAHSMRQQFSLLVFKIYTELRKSARIELWKWCEKKWSGKEVRKQDGRIIRVSEGKLFPKKSLPGQCCGTAR